MRRFQILVLACAFGVQVPSVAATQVEGGCVEVTGEVRDSKISGALAELVAARGSKSEAHYSLIVSAKLSAGAIFGQIGMRSSFVGVLRRTVDASGHKSWLLECVSIRPVGPDPLQRRSHDGIRQLASSACAP